MAKIGQSRLDEIEARDARNVSKTTAVKPVSAPVSAAGASKIGSTKLSEIEKRDNAAKERRDLITSAASAVVPGNFDTFNANVERYAAAMKGVDAKNYSAKDVYAENKDLADKIKLQGEVLLKAMEMQKQKDPGTDFQPIIDAIKASMDSVSKNVEATSNIAKAYNKYSTEEQFNAAMTAYDEYMAKTPEERAEIDEQNERAKAYYAKTHRSTVAEYDAEIERFDDLERELKINSERYDALLGEQLLLDPESEEYEKIGRILERIEDERLEIYKRHGVDDWTAYNYEEATGELKRNRELLYRDQVIKKIEAANRGVEKYGTVDFDGDYQKRGVFTDDQWRLYTGLIAQGKKDVAKEYYDALKVKYNQKVSEDTKEVVGKVYEWIDDLPPVISEATNVLANILTVPVNIIGGALDLVGNAGYAATGDISYEYAANGLSNVAQTYRENTAADIQKDLEKAGANATVARVVSGGYQAAMSGIDSLSIMLVSRAAGSAALAKAIQVGYTISMGGSAASREAIERYEKGYEGKEIALAAVGAGVCEALFEKVSLEQVLDARKFKNLFVSAAISAGVEGSEELFTNWGNRIWQSIVLAGNTDLDAEISELMAKGYTEKEARKEAWKNAAIEDIESFLGGAFSGGLSGMLVSGVERVRYTEQISNIADRLADMDAEDLFVYALENEEILTVGTNDLLKQMVDGYSDAQVEELRHRLLGDAGLSIAKEMGLHEKYGEEKTEKIGDKAFAPMASNTETQTEAQTSETAASETVAEEANTETKTELPKTESSVKTEITLDNSTESAEEALLREASDNKSEATLNREAVQALGKELGFTVKFDNNLTMPDGVTPTSAKVNRSTMTITLNPKYDNAMKQVFSIAALGIIGEQSRLNRDAKHEFTHTAEGSKRYDSFTKTVRKSSVYTEWLAKQRGVGKGSVKDMEAKLVERIIVERGMAGEKLSNAAAMQEIMANFCGEVLYSGQIDTLLETVKADEKRTIIEFFRDILARIRRAFAGKNTKIESEIRDLERRYARMLGETSNQSKALDEAGIQVDAQNGSANIQYNLDTFDESEVVKNTDKVAREIASAIGVSVEKAKAYLNDMFSIAARIAGDPKLDYKSAMHTAFVSNVEYDGSIEFSTICAKRRMITGTLSAIQQALPDSVLSAQDFLDIRNAMINKGYVVNCGLCYVEGSRAQMGGYARQFIDRYWNYIDRTGETPELSRGELNMALVNTADGVEEMFQKYPKLYELYNQFWNNNGRLNPGEKSLFASQQKPKMFMARTAYNGEVIENFFGNDEKISRRNTAGGLRMFSFSDFELVHALDCMQVITDMARCGLAGQAYTKVYEFAKIFGATGYKINLSLIAKGVGADGKLIFDDREGMKHDIAFNLRKGLDENGNQIEILDENGNDVAAESFKKNVGTIVVVFDDAQLKAAMADDRIDFIIPFHRSQWKKSMYPDIGLPKTTKDYTSQQNEKWLSKNDPKNFHLYAGNDPRYIGKMIATKPTNYAPNAYWNPNISGKENAELYLEMCYSDGKRPKFYKLLDTDGKGRYFLKEDGSTDGYWKLLIDFKMYDVDGNFAEQEKVRPVFNTKAVDQLFDEYKGGHESYPVAQDVVDDFLKTKEAKAKRGKLTFVGAKSAEQFQYDIDDDFNIDEAEKTVVDLRRQIADLRDQRIALESTDEYYDAMSGDEQALYDWRVSSGHEQVVGQLDNLVEQKNELSATLKKAKAARPLEAHELARSLAKSYKSSGDLESVTENIQGAIDASMKGETASALEFARKAAESITESLPITEYAHNIRDAIKDTTIKFSDMQKSEIANRYEKYGVYLSQLFGKINVDNQNGLDLDVAWMQWAAQFPEVFDAEISDLDMPGALSEIILATAEMREEIDPRIITLDIMNAVIENKDRVRFREISEQNKSLKVQNKALREKVDAAAEEQKKTYERIKKEVDFEREQRQNRTVNINELRKSVTRLNTKLTTNSKTKHVPQYLQGAIKDFCSMFISDDGEYKIDRKILSDIATKYDSLNSDEESNLGGWCEDVSNYIKTAAELLDGKTVRELSGAELGMLRDIAANMEHIVNEGNQMFLDGKKQNRTEIGMAGIDALRKSGKTAKSLLIKGKKASTIDAAGGYFGVFNDKPIFFFDKLGGVFKTAFNDLMQAQYDCVRLIENVHNFADETMRKHKYWSWIDGTVKIELDGGRNVEIPIGDALSIYATYKRQKTNADMHQRHLDLGGFRLNDASTKKLIQYGTVETDLFVPTQEQLDSIFKQLGAEKMAFVDEMVEYMSTYMSSIGNKTSMQMWGINIFNETYYFPYQSDQDYTSKETKDKDEKGNSSAQATVGKMKNMGFTNRTVAYASNPIVIKDFMDTFASHCDRMCQFGTMVVPLETMEGLRLFKTNASENEETGLIQKSESVRAELRKTFGDNYATYFKTFIDDMNGGAQRTPGEAFLTKLTSWFKKHAVAGSLSVMIQQGSAACRSWAFIDPKYMMNFPTKLSSAEYEECKLYCPVAILKSIGRFDTGLGQTFSDYIKDSGYENGKQKRKNVGTLKTIEALTMAGAEKADEKTWGILWAACKAQTKAETGLEFGTEEFYHEAAKLFNKVIEYTQVYDSTLTRSQNMRDKSALMQSVTAFLAEPTTTMNLAKMAITEISKGNKKLPNRILASLVANLIVNNMLKALIYSIRDDDENKSWLEKYLGEFVRGSADDLVPLNYIPWLKDLWSAIQGYSNERSDLTVAYDLIDLVEDSVKMFKDDNVDGMKLLKNILSLAGYASGIPAKNIIRDGEALYNAIENIVKGNVTPNHGANVGLSIVEALPFGSSSKSSYYEKIYKALNDGDTKAYEEYFQYLVDHGTDESKIYSGVKKAAKSSDDFKKIEYDYKNRLESMPQYEKLSDESKDDVITKLLDYEAEKIVSSAKGEMSSAAARAEKFKQEGIDPEIYYLVKAMYEDTNGDGKILKADKEETVKKSGLGDDVIAKLLKNLP